MGRSLAFLIVFSLATIVRAEPSGYHFQFREPGLNRYHLTNNASLSRAEWLEARDERSNQRVELGSRVVLQLDRGESLSNVLAGTLLVVSRNVGSNLFILQASDALAAAREADRLASRGHLAAPVMRRARQLHGSFAFKPNDPYAFNAWNLEHRYDPGAGVDLNVRAAWPYTRGAGVTIAFGDDGVEYTHPDLCDRAQGMPHYNFGLGTTNGLPNNSVDKHATAVAGLALASLNNFQGACGVAPEAGLASWKIFNTNQAASDEQLMDMFLSHNDSVAVQNHSWGFEGGVQKGPSLLEKTAIAQAAQSGRGGRGVVMVRSVGNSRISFGGNVVRGNANDDLYPSDPNVIAVAAVWANGRAASYSNPGASILVAAPGGDLSDPSLMTLFTTDRQGIAGYNYKSYSNNLPLSDYCFNDTAFSGTSAAAPQVAGVAALILSVNTNLSYRDVQQILVHSSRHFDWADPDVTTNGAGFVVSHNVGFGVPDAGMAVRLARTWPARPPLTVATLTAPDINANAPAAIPNDGRRVQVFDETGMVQSFGSIDSLGTQADSGTAQLPLVDVGLASGPITLNLTNKAALIKRGGNDFRDKIRYAADAGAAFAVVYDNADDASTEHRIIMGNTDFVPIPAVFISMTDGNQLHASLLQSNLQARLSLDSMLCTFMVTNTMLCEHLAVRLNIQHPRRSDIRITLTSPQGTRSVLGRVNVDTNACTDWTYVSTHHFYESSYGLWTLAVSDEAVGATGAVHGVSLSVYGVPIADSDHDGLDDAWEMAHFGSLAYGPKDDPDRDGYNNMREQIMGTDPNGPNDQLQMDLSRWDEKEGRLSWPADPYHSYTLLTGTNASSLSAWTNVAGTFPENHIFMPSTNQAWFFQLRRQ